MYDNYEPLSFMMILLFVYLILILFIFMLIYNNIHGSKKELKNALLGTNNNNSTSNSNNTTCINCIPAPTKLLGNTQYY
jgi:hypothetical protein